MGLVQFVTIDPVCSTVRQKEASPNSQKGPAASERGQYPIFSALSELGQAQTELRTLRRITTFGGRTYSLSPPAPSPLFRAPHAYPVRGFGFKGTGTPNTRADLCKTWEFHKISVTLLAAIAEFERELIRERTGDGRKRAMANGVKFGRKPKLSPFQRAEAIKRRAAGETLASIAKTYAVDLSMISRL